MPRTCRHGFRLGSYTPLLARHISKAMLGGPRPCVVCTPPSWTRTTKSMGTPIPTPWATCLNPRGYTCSVPAKLLKNLGHPSNAGVCRAVRLNGVSDAAVQAALRYRCPMCIRLKEPTPMPSGSLRDRWHEFNACLGIDLLC